MTQEMNCLASGGGGTQVPITNASSKLSYSDIKCIEYDDCIVITGNVACTAKVQMNEVIFTGVPSSSYPINGKGLLYTGAGHDWSSDSYCRQLTVNGTSITMTQNYAMDTGGTWYVNFAYPKAPS